MKRVRDHHRVYRFAVRLKQIDRRKWNRGAGGAAEGDIEHVVAHDLKLQRALFHHAIKRAAIRIGDFFRRQQYRFQQAVDIGFLGQRDANLVELLETLEQAGGIRRALHLVHRRSLYLIQTARTCAMSVIPPSTFSMPSCFRVRMPSSSAVASISATRACS